MKAQQAKLVVAANDAVFTTLPLRSLAQGKITAEFANAEIVAKYDGGKLKSLTYWSSDDLALAIRKLNQLDVACQGCGRDRGRRPVRRRRSVVVAESRGRVPCSPYLKVATTVLQT